MALCTLVMLDVGSAGAANDPAARPSHLVVGTQVAKTQNAGTPNAGNSARPGRDEHVTLISGDRVILTGGDLGKAVITPAKGREGRRFRVNQVGDSLYVVPSDFADQVQTGRLDRRLFDVAALIKSGYDDRSGDAIPVIVKHRGDAAPVPGATASRALRVVGGTAAKVLKRDAAAFAAQVRDSAGVEKVWLDAKRKPVLDHSVVQVGAPTAWQAGFTGKNVMVAVVDTGIDAAHPDLTTRVADSKNFTASPAGDNYGHGTHVASTIAGTGAASDGRYKGVAPDARLLDAKVCDDNGSCPDSAIIAGMEWAAVEKHADVVNVSLGEEDLPEVEPLEEAINQLTAQTGTLFVVAAGNSGPREGTVESPGSAEAALTVGAVDKSDELVSYSSRGPRAGDAAVKPDMTAPGDPIVAAKARNAVIGQPVDEFYTSLGGTSMATPHVAGAAALLAEQHADWHAPQLKSALTGSAKPHAQQTVSEQGSGRLDVTRAIQQKVFSQPGNVSFGDASWPHDDDAAVSKQLTYRNFGDAPVTLSLDATFAGPGAEPAPAGALELSADAVTIPAGGTASVTVTSNTRHSGPDGTYTGHVAATSGDVAVITPVVVNKEVESYNLTLSSIGPDGRPITTGETLLARVDLQFSHHYPAREAITVRLPKGEYVLDTVLDVARGGPQDVYNLVAPRVVLDRDQRVTFDARQARPLDVTVPRGEASVALWDLRYELTGRRIGGGLFGTDGLRGVYSAHVGEPTGSGELVSHLGTQWGVKKDGSFDRTPYTYNLLDVDTSGRFFTGVERVVKAGELAALVDRHATAASGRDAAKWVSGGVPGLVNAYAALLWYDLPSAVTHYVETKGGVVWTTELAEAIPNPDHPMPLQKVQLKRPATSYEAGRTYRDRWNVATFGPSFLGGYARHTDEGISVGLTSFVDGSGHGGWTETEEETTKLFRNGELIGEMPAFGFMESGPIPAERATYQLIAEAARTSGDMLSTRVRAEWTFTSEATPGGTTPLPLRMVGFHPPVDDANQVPRTAVSAVPLSFTAQEGQSLGAPSRIDVQVSGDDGASWQRGSVVRRPDGTYHAVFATPQRGPFVSLRAKVVDTEGATLEQTVIRAYGLR